MYYKGLIDRYREYLPVSESTPIITLNEGNTPLIKADNLAKKIGLDANIYLKFEGCNPTGSFKDRGMTMAVTKAKEGSLLSWLKWIKTTVFVSFPINLDK